MGDGAEFTAAMRKFIINFLKMKYARAVFQFLFIAANKYFAESFKHLVQWLKSVNIRINLLKNFIKVYNRLLIEYAC